MPHKLVKHRRAAWHRQQGRCHYCGLPTWEEAADAFAASHHLSRKQASWLRSTAEHLVARSAGGSNASSNLVAACLHCNQTRHKASAPLGAEAYRLRVRRLLANGHWWPRELRQLGQEQIKAPAAPDPRHADPCPPKRPGCTTRT